MKSSLLQTCLFVVAACAVSAAPSVPVRDASLRQPVASAVKRAPLATRISREVSAVLARHAAETQSETLWATVRREVGEVLFQFYRNGELLGTKPEQAYSVRCDRTTMTTADIEGGVLKVVVGYAAVKPAEFEVLTLQQAVRKP